MRVSIPYRDLAVVSRYPTFPGYPTLLELTSSGRTDLTPQKRAEPSRDGRRKQGHQVRYSTFTNTQPAPGFVLLSGT